MDYEKICQMKDRDGNGLVIMGGVSVTTTLPKGKPDDVKNEIKWLVEKGPKRGLVLQASSSVAPGVPWENIEAMIEGFKYYREKGRK
jgi:uroporphyrinogen-III decarboxylase